MINVTSVVLGLMTLLGGCGWFIDRRKHRQEIESMKADIRRKELDLGTEFVQRYRELITGPLEEDVGKLRIEIKELRNAIEGINDCPYRADCPVWERLQREPKVGGGERGELRG